MDSELYTESNTPQDAVTAPGSAPQSLREHVYVSLREELMSGRLTPWERLSEEGLAHRFGVSRTPVREALARLQSDGLVEKRDGGLYLYLPSFDELAGLYELRIALEVEGIRRVLENAELHHDVPALKEELNYWYELRANPPSPDAGFVSSDEQFHTALLESSGNPIFTETLVGVNRRIRPVRMYDYLTADRIDATISEHIAIAELVVDGKLTAAMTAIKAHVGHSREVVVQRASQAMTYARMASKSTE